MHIGNSISSLKPHHSREVSILHANLVPGLLQELGYSIIKLFYETAIQFEYNFGFVHTEANRITGFVFGTTDRTRLYKDVAVKRPFVLIIHMLRLVVKNPKKIRLLIKVIFCKPHVHDSGCNSELVFVAVDPLHQKCGIGKNLMNHFHDHLIQKGLSCYEASVEIKNESAQRFNDKLGFQLIYHYTEFGIERLRYSCDLSHRLKQ